MKTARLAAIALTLALPLLGGCVMGGSETVTGTIVYPPGYGKPEKPETYGTEAPKPTGAAARPVFDEPKDSYVNAVRCAASQEKLLRLNTYMVTRQNLYDMEDAIEAWTDLAVHLGAERGLTENQVEREIWRMADALPGREANRISLGCVVKAD